MGLESGVPEGQVKELVEGGAVAPVDYSGPSDGAYPHRGGTA